MYRELRFVAEEEFEEIIRNVSSIICNLFFILILNSNDPEALISFFSSLTKQEALWDSKVLNYFALMAIGPLFMILFTFRVPRNSARYKCLFVIFVIYELVVFSGFFGLYLQGIYMQSKENFKKKAYVKDENGNK